MKIKRELKRYLLWRRLLVLPAPVDVAGPEGWVECPASRGSSELEAPPCGPSSDAVAVAATWALMRFFEAVALLLPR